MLMSGSVHFIKNCSNLYHSSASLCNIRVSESLCETARVQYLFFSKIKISVAYLSQSCCLISIRYATPAGQIDYLNNVLTNTDFNKFVRTFKKNKPLRVLDILHQFNEKWDQKQVAFMILELNIKFQLAIRHSVFFSLSHPTNYYANTVLEAILQPFSSVKKGGCEMFPVCCCPQEQVLYLSSCQLQKSLHSSFGRNLSKNSCGTSVSVSGFKDCG